MQDPEEEKRAKEKIARSEAASTEPEVNEIDNGGESSAKSDRIVEGETVPIKLKTSKAGVRRENEESPPDTQNQDDPTSFDMTAKPINVGGRVGIKQSPDIENQSQVHEPTLTKSAPTSEESAPDAQNPGEISKPTSSSSATVSEGEPRSDGPVAWTDESIKGAWTCKFNPKRTDDVRSEAEILKEIESEHLYWPIHTHINEVHDGQLVFIWRGGRGRQALMAVGRINQIMGVGNPALPNSASRYSLSIAILEIGPEDGIPENEFLEAGLSKSAYIQGRQSFIKLYESDVNILNKVATDYGIKPRSGYGFPDHLRETESVPKQGNGDNEEVRTLDDTRTSIDLLNRQIMAETLAKRIDLIWNRQSRSEAKDPLIMHLNAPWGAGKSSFFDFLHKALGNGSNSDHLTWIIVEHNAWQHQHIEPPWWSLYQEIYRQSLKELSNSPLFKRIYWPRIRLRIREWYRRVISGRKLLMISGVIVLMPLLLIALSDTAAEAIYGVFSENTGKDMTTLQLWSGLGAFISAVFSGARAFLDTLLGGSAENARNYQTYSRDPQIKLKEKFDSLARDIGQPILVFIDDIDRCKPAYVVDLLEGLMTVFRSNRVFFMIAGDASWINRCFENEYREFTDLTRDPGRTLGHNFLEKVFQFTVHLPAMEQNVLQRYWRHLLHPDFQSDKSVGNSEEATERNFTEISDNESDFRADFRTFEAEQLERESNTREAMRQYQTEEADTNIQNFLVQFDALLEPNPRAMKRLVNAYVMWAIMRTAQLGDELSVEEKSKLALWVIFSHRWPVIVDYLSHNRNDVDKFFKWATTKTQSKVTGGWQESLIPVLRQRREIGRVLKGEYEATGAEKFKLNAEEINNFLGPSKPFKLGQHPET